ncbi:hypothetical protein [Elioraea sp.]|uniref:hypothetical protein n=1 Tax=Elioraea sp. TaxID=2185103 RepID=UPI0021DDF179|nr:hypothetical protein [Elioraea sp.]GIX10387.1 MAG: hypothetical protein KatS3mg116_2097 [Elioraea sp.]
MAQTMRRSKEKRWIVLGEDGRHVTLGRHTDPTDAEIAAVQGALAAQGLGGWLAIMEGDYFGRRSPPALLMVRPLGSPAERFEAAVEAFETTRQQSFPTA